MIIKKEGVEPYSLSQIYKTVSIYSCSETNLSNYNGLIME